MTKPSTNRTGIERMDDSSGDQLSRVVGMSSPDLVHAGIVRGLYESRYVPGQRLVEPAMMLEFGVSRSSVREALRRLAAEGLVILSPHRGAYIRLLSRQELEDMLLLLEVLLGLAARLAALRIRLEDNEMKFAAAAGELVEVAKSRDFRQFTRAKNRFYRALTSIAQNREIDRVLPNIQVHLIRVQSGSTVVTDAAVDIEDYLEIAEAVLAGEPTWAERSARRHVVRVRAALEPL